ncbi:11392_t:CDS:2, partial [Acaulospora colombiana]
MQIMDLIDNIIKGHNILLYDYNEFTDFVEIGEVALKSLKKELSKEFVRGFVKEHSKNVLVHDETMLIADFGISKWVNGPDDTPEEYIRLYTRCWDKNSEERPTSQEVFDILSEMMSEGTDIDSSDNVSISETSDSVINVSINPPSLSSAEDSLSSKGIKTPDEDSLLDVLNSSVLIRLDHFAVISTWIDKYPVKYIPKFFRSKKVYTTENFPYIFELLVRGSRDGFTPEVFHQKCDNKGPTLTVLKVKESGEILGGFNPFSWESPPESNYYYTKKSFIFRIDLHNARNSIISRAKNHESIKSGKHYGPYFRGDLSMEGNFRDD